MVTMGGALHPLRGAGARLLPALLVLALGGSIMAVTRSRVVGVTAIIAVCALDLGSFAFAGPWRDQGVRPSQAAALFSSSPPPWGAAFHQPGGIDRWVSDVPDASEIWPSLVGHPGQTVNGYDNLLQSDYSQSVGYMAYLGYLPSHVFWEGGWLPDVLRVTTLFASPYAGPISSRWTYSHTYDWPADAPRTNPAVGAPIAPSYAVYDYAPRLPESYLVGAARLTALGDARVALNTPGTDLTQYAFVDGGTIPPSAVGDFTAIAQPGFSGSVTSGAMNDGGSGTWSVTAARPSLFVTSYAWMDGWHATVDGKSVPVARTNALVLGVPLPAGPHTVHLSFTPPGWIEGRDISLASLLALIVLLFSANPHVRAYVKRRAPRIRNTRRVSEELD
jgi:hypothetical protein